MPVGRYSSFAVIENSLPTTGIRQSQIHRAILTRTWRNAKWIARLLRNPELEFGDILEARDRQSVPDTERTNDRRLSIEVPFSGLTGQTRNHRLGFDHRWRLQHLPASRAQVRLQRWADLCRAARGIQHPFGWRACSSPWEIRGACFAQCCARVEPSRRQDRRRGG